MSEITQQQFTDSNTEDLHLYGAPDPETRVNTYDFTDPFDSDFNPNFEHDPVNNPIYTPEERQESASTGESLEFVRARGDYARRKVRESAEREAREAIDEVHKQRLEEERLAALTPDNIMSSSRHVLQAVYPRFQENLKLYTEGGGRTSYNTLGGSALGNTENRIRLSENEAALDEAVRARLGEIISRSQSIEAKERASSKNAADVAGGRGFWSLGDFVHSTDYFHVGDIMYTGLVSCEFHGAKAKTDTTPLEADFSEIVDEVTDTEQAFGNNGRTYTSDRGGAVAVLLKFRRDIDAIDYGEDSSGNLDESPAHRTVFIGLPSTEISGILVVGDSVDTDKLIASVVASGQYVPVYNRDGELVFTPDEFVLRSGVEIQDSGEPKNPSEQLDDTKSQIVRMAERLFDLAPRDNKGNSKNFNNSKYARYMLLHDSSDMIWLNEKTGKRHVKTSIDIGDGQRLHVYEKDDGQLDMFISSLDGEAQPITDADLPAVRHRLASTFNHWRSTYSKLRAEEKNKEKAEELAGSSLVV